MIQEPDCPNKEKRCQMADEVLTERRGRVLLITLNRPDAMNAINTPLAQALNAALAELDESPDLTVGILTGAGRGFSAGMDLKAFAKEGFPEGFDEFIQVGCKKPLIAAVEGFALAGGLEIALSCDLIVGAENSRFGIPEVGVGLFAAGGALLRLPQRVPYGLAMELALTGDPIPAAEALTHRLIDRVAPKGSAVEVAMELAERIAKNAPLAVIASKQTLKAQKGTTTEDFWKVQIPMIKDVFSSEDSKEGPAAFAQKRAPQWSGK